MNPSTSHLRIKPNICFFSDYQNNSFYSWVIDDWCELFASIGYLTSPMHHLTHGRNHAPLELALKRDMRGVDIDANWFDADLCIGYSSTFFCDLNVLNKIKSKKCKTVLIIKQLVIEEKEKKAISSSLVDEVWIVDYAYCQSSVDAILSFNLMQKICIINDYYVDFNIEKRLRNKAIFSFRKKDTDYIKSRNLLESLSKHFELDQMYFHEVFANKHKLFNDHEFIILYATSDLNGDDARIVDFCDKKCFTVINKINEYLSSLYRTYSSVSEILDMKENYDKPYDKVPNPNSISMKKAIIDIIQRR